MNASQDITQHVMQRCEARGKGIDAQTVLDLCTRLKPLQADPELQKRFPFREPLSYASQFLEDNARAARSADMDLVPENKTISFLLNAEYALLPPLAASYREQITRTESLPSGNTRYNQLNSAFESFSLARRAFLKDLDLGILSKSIDRNIQSQLQAFDKYMG